MLYSGFMNKPDLSKRILVKETRWHRHYALEEPRHFQRESKFADGSAHITLEELGAEWPSWSEGERIDFCQEVDRATFSHLPDILRFIMCHGDHRNWSGIALTIVRLLPADESIPFLLKACHESPVDEGSTHQQALAKSGAPEAHAMIRNRLECLWKDEGLFITEPHINHVASATIFCIKHLLELGETPAEFTDRYQALLNHPNESNRLQVQNFLAKHFIA